MSFSKRVSLFAALAVATPSCVDLDRSSEHAGQTENPVYIGDDGEARPDNQEHPQVVRLGFTRYDGDGGTCTAWLSSSNTLTTNTHCTQGSFGFSIFALNSSPAQAAAFAALGSPIAVVEHPAGQYCTGGDLAVLVYDPARAIPRTVLKPLPIMTASEEPECDGDETCVMLVGAGRVDEDCWNEDSPDARFGTVNQLYMESGLGDGNCDYDSDMLYGEYDYDDSTGCKGDSGSPVIWRATGQVMAVNRGQGGDGGDDSVGPILWGSDHSARGFFFAEAADRDRDGRQAGYDNCDLVVNPLQEDFNGNDFGDACEDSDGDGLLDGRELLLGTNPAVGDTDGDGLTDGAEVDTHGTDPLVVDTDNDGLTDGEEVNVYGTNPLVADTDNDGLTDGEEVEIYGTNPLVVDTDGDDLGDGEEVEIYGTNPLVVDTDGDGLGDGEEVHIHGTSPLMADTDGDLIDDGLEVEYGLDPLDEDTDDDGLVDGRDIEFIEAAMARLADDVFHGPGNRNAVLNHLEQAQAAAQDGRVDNAVNRLDALRKHIDGCGATAGNDDWIQSCPEQIGIRELVNLLIANLGNS